MGDYKWADNLSPAVSRVISEKIEAVIKLMMEEKDIDDQRLVRGTTPSTIPLLVGEGEEAGIFRRKGTLDAYTQRAAGLKLKIENLSRDLRKSLRKEGIEEKTLEKAMSEIFIDIMREVETRRGRLTEEYLREP